MSQPSPNRRILIVDDNRAIHSDFSRILGGISAQRLALEAAEARLFLDTKQVQLLPAFELSHAMQGEEACAVVERAIAESRPFAMAFVDIRMPPGIDGVETAARLWRLQPDLQIVICTAHTDYSFDAITARLGTSDRLLILKKPFDAVEVRQLAQAITEKWRLLRDERARTEDLERIVAARTQELHAANARLAEQARLLDLTHDGISVRDLDDRVQFWSLGAERIYGCRGAEICGKQVGDVLYRNFKNFESAKAEVLESGQWLGEITHPTRSGAELIIDSRWTLVRDEQGAPQAILVVDRDITERKQLEHQFLRAQRLESIGTLASGVAHDLNNILAPILMSAHMLREPMPPEAVEEILATIESAAERGAAIVQQVLTFGRGVEGERVLLQPKQLVQEIVKIARETFPKNIEIDDFPASDLWMLKGDATQLHQVLLNLCVNARDAMQRGGKLSISVENLAVDEHFASMLSGLQPGPYVLIKVSDTGTGIPSGVVGMIFDPFFTTKAPGQGTGLGLSTVLGIVKSHGGVVNVQSKNGSGTTFEIYLPASREHAAPKIVTPRSVAPHAGNGERILVVDDEIGIRTITGAMLKKSGYRVLQAGEGTEALALFAQHSADIAVVLTDLMMPNVDGLTLIRALRKMSPGIRVIAASGQGQDARLSELRSLNPNAFLAKPFSREKLLGTLQQVLQSN
ncbi:MAG: response regulator [Chthoniobacteraceae bacterium]